LDGIHDARAQSPSEARSFPKVLATLETYPYLSLENVAMRQRMAYCIDRDMVNEPCAVSVHRALFRLSIDNLLTEG